jgi:hypothetical protein
MFEAAGQRHLLGVGRRGTTERIIPDQGCNAGADALSIVRGEDARGELRGERRLSKRSRAPSRNGGRRNSNANPQDSHPGTPSGKLAHSVSTATESTVHCRVSRSAWRKSQEWKEALNGTAINLH